MADHRKIQARIVPASSAAIFVEGHVHRPMQVVLDAPIGAHRLEDGFRVGRHAVLDNSAAHKHPAVEWLARHPRWTFHFTPTSASWINLVERFFGLITGDAIRRGVFHSVEELKTAIQAYLDQHNGKPKPFVWAAKAADILQKVARGRQVLESVH